MGDLVDQDSADRQEAQTAMEARAQSWREEWDELARKLEERLLSRLQAGQSGPVREQAQGAAGEAGTAPRTKRRRD